MRFPVRLGRLRNTQGGRRSAPRSGYSTYTPPDPPVDPPMPDPPTEQDPPAAPGAVPNPNVSPSTPVARITSDQNIVSVRAPIRFDGSGSTGRNLTYSWNFGAGADPATDTVVEPSCIYTTPGEKSVTLTVTDDRGVESDLATLNITVDPCVPLLGETEPPWLTEARTYLNLHENTDRTEIEKLFEFGEFDINPQVTSWCAAFVGSVLAKKGLGHTHLPGSRSYRTWGEPCEERVGAVVVFNGHVGFVSSLGKVLGGNQSDRVNIQPQSWYGTVHSYRWPSECPCPDEPDESGETDGQSSQ